MYGGKTRNRLSGETFFPLTQMAMRAKSLVLTFLAVLAPVTQSSAECSLTIFTYEVIKVPTESKPVTLFVVLVVSKHCFPAHGRTLGERRGISPLEILEVSIQSLMTPASNSQPHAFFMPSVVSPEF